VTEPRRVVIHGDFLFTIHKKKSAITPRREDDGVKVTTNAAPQKPNTEKEVRAVVWQQEGCWFDPRASPPPS